jgi:hypothetical protein
MNRQQKTKPTFQITWIALVVVLQLLSLYLNQLYPFIGYWFTFIFPIFTILVLLSLTWRGLVIYAVTSMLLIMMLIQPAMEVILFYWLPSFILGIGYVIGLKQKATLFSMVLFLSVTQLVVLYMVRIFSLWLYEVDLLAFIYLFLNLTNVDNIFLLNPMMLYAIGLLQITISISFMIPVMERFGIYLPYQLMLTRIEVYAYVALFFVGLISIGFAPQLSLFALGPLTLLSVYSYLYFFMRPVRFAVYPLLMGLILYPFVNAYFSDILEGPYRILSIIFIAIIPLALMMCKSFTQKKKNALI